MWKYLILDWLILKGDNCHLMITVSLTRMKLVHVLIKKNDLL